MICVIFLFFSCSHKKDIPELLEGSFQAHTVSFDGIKPIVDLGKNNLKGILVLLHHRVTEEKIKIHFKMNDSIWNDRINYLFGQGLIKKANNGEYLPTFFILDNDNAVSIKKFTDSLGVEISGIALDRLAKIKEATAKIPSLKNIAFENISLFILGGVTHDYWQEKSYQDQFIKSFVPHRGNACYYYALIQNENLDEKSPKIFETNIYDYQAFQFGNYGYLGSEISLATFPSSILINSFGCNATDGDSIFREKLISDLIGLGKNPAYKIDVKRLEGFKRFGMITNGKCLVPYITRVDAQKLYDVAALITPDLVNYFENRQTLFVKHYLNSQYRDETNYKEWMVWIYKMITTRAVEELINKSVIKIPFDRKASFILQK
jgi:hypothetical protein